MNNPLNTDDAAFVKGRSAISWVGYWKYADYRKAFGDDLVILPLPNFGWGSKTGEGSWQWTVTTKAKDADAAWAFVKTLFDKPYQREVAANGGIPAVKSVLAEIPEFRPGGPEAIYVEQLDSGVAVPRPATPAYPTISLSMSKVMSAVRSGGDVKAALDQAAKAIDQDINDNNGYPAKS